jgi:hypothetical protein
MPAATRKRLPLRYAALCRRGRGGASRVLRAVFDAQGEHHPNRPAEVRIGDSLVNLKEA